MRIYTAPVMLSRIPLLFAGSSWHNVSLRLKYVCSFTSVTFVVCLISLCDKGIVAVADTG